VVIATLELEPFVELVEDELRDILSYLKEEAKKEKEHTSISIGSERRQQIMSLINEKYRNVEKVKRKIEEGEIELVFHPIVMAEDTKEIAGAEVLVRLKEGEKLVPAGIFIDLIYELDLIEKLDLQVLEKLLEYREKLTPAEALFVNVSSRSLMSEDYLKRFSEFISEMRNVRVIVELTEQQLLENPDYVLRISEMGDVALAVDDFGTGYSSLKLVADLAERGVLKILKIDGSFTRDILRSHSTQKVVDVISVMSKKLGVRTVAEFVESEEELSAVRKLGIDCCQGYYIAKPMILHEFLAWIKGLR